jgi:hypothetical protein
MALGIDGAGCGFQPLLLYPRCRRAEREVARQRVRLEVLTQALGERADRINGLMSLLVDIKGTIESEVGWESTINSIDSHLGINTEQAAKARLRLTRDVPTAECPWLGRDMKAGETVYRYDGHTYGCLTDGIPCTIRYGEPPFFELPREAVGEVTT